MQAGGEWLVGIWILGTDGDMTSHIWGSVGFPLWHPPEGWLSVASQQGCLIITKYSRKTGTDGRVRGLYKGAQGGGPAELWADADNGSEVSSDSEECLVVTSGKPEMRMGPEACVSELEGGPGAMKVERWLTACRINGTTSIMAWPLPSSMPATPGEMCNQAEPWCLVL